jgi:hypothetical protein
MILLALNTNFNSFSCSGKRPCTGSTRNFEPIIPNFAESIFVYKNILKPNFHAVTVKNAALNQYFSEFWTDGSMEGSRNNRWISLKFREFVEKSLFIIYSKIQ